MSLSIETGIDDYNIVYHEASDISYGAEDTVNRAGKLLFEDLPVKVEIRNQARVHLWYGARYGIDLGPIQVLKLGLIVDINKRDVSRQICGQWRVERLCTSRTF